jgi:hypothetical protein
VKRNGHEIRSEPFSIDTAKGSGNSKIDGSDLAAHYDF